MKKIVNEKTKTTSVRDNRSEIVYRARCVLGMRGVPNHENIMLNVTSIESRRSNSVLNGVMTNDQLAAFAVLVAEDTLYY